MEDSVFYPAFQQKPCSCLPKPFLVGEETSMPFLQLPYKLQRIRNLALGQNAMAAGGTLAYLPGARERHCILTLYPGKSDFPTEIMYYRVSQGW